MEKKERGTQRHMVRGSAWTIAMRWTLRLTGLISTIILARLLTPADYGIVSIAMVIVGTVEIFSQTGQYAAIVRMPNPTREHYNSAWTVSLILGFALGLIIWAATPLTVAYFHEPRAAPVVVILAFRTMMLGSQNIGIIDFRRDLEFHKQYWFSVWPSLISFVMTIVAAFLLRNYWALVIGMVSQHISNVTLSYVMSSYRPRICFTKVREIWTFSVWSLFKSIGIYVNNQVDKVVIGGFAGAAAMGRYDVARDIAISPSQELINPVITVLFPVMAKVQDDQVKRRQLFLSVLYWSALICTSASVGVALVSEDMADLVLGPQWHDVSKLMPWFSLSWGILGLASGVYAAFDTINRPIVSARLQWMRVIALTVAVVPVAYFYRSLEAVVITRFIVTILITPTLFYALSKALDVPMRDFGIAIWRPMAAGFAMAAVVLGINAEIGFTGTFRLAIDIAAGALSYTTALMALWLAVGRPDGPEKEVWKRLHRWTAPLRRKAFSKI